MTDLRVLVLGRRGKDLGQTQKCSGATPGLVLRGDTWQCLGGLYAELGSEAECLLHARQVPKLPNYSSC